MAVIKNEPTTFPMPQNCFVCGNQVNVPCIFWQGTDGHGITLHFTCAEYLGLNILNDYLESQKYLATEKESHVR